MAQNKRYFRLHESVGVEPDVLVDGYDGNGQPVEVENPKAGELGPLVAEGLAILAPAIAEDGVTPILDIRSVEVTPDGAYVIEDRGGTRARVGLADTNDKVHDAATRVLALSTPRIIDAVLQTGKYEEISAPKSAQKRSAKEPASAGEEA